MTVKIDLLKKEHLDIFNSRDGLPENLEADTAVAIMYKDIVIAIFGLEVQRQGVAEGWLYGAHEIEKYPHTFFKSAIWAVESAIKHYKLHRLEIAVSEDQGKWAEKLGFKFESRMEKWSEEGEDYLRYVRIR